MQVIGVLGSGFGLYGYLPALVELGIKNIVLPRRYRKKFSHRDELKIYAGFINWVSDDAMFEMVDTLVIALPPEQQLNAARSVICLENIKNFILEKPLAVSPDESYQLLSELEQAKKKIRIGYNFRFTSWGKRFFHFLRNNVNEERSKISITWNFLAPHYRNDALVWKRYDKFGGGALRFYGIHLVALLAEHGYDSVLFSRKYFEKSDELVKWEAAFSGKNNPPCYVFVDSKAAISHFQISKQLTYKKYILFECEDPFGCVEDTAALSGQDKRVPYLVDFCQTVLHDDEMTYEWYRKSIDLWSQVEGVSSAIWNKFL